MESSLAVTSLLPAHQPSLWPWDLSCQAVRSPKSGRQVVSARGPLRAVVSAHRCVLRWISSEDPLIPGQCSRHGLGVGEDVYIIMIPVLGYKAAP